MHDGAVQGRGDLVLETGVADYVISDGRIMINPIKYAITKEDVFTGGLVDIMRLRPWS